MKDSGLKITYFRRPLDENFSENLVKSAINTLANTLALDFAARLEGKIEAADHSDSVIAKLKKFIGVKVFLDDSFGWILTLFAIAVSDKEENEGSKNSLSLEENIDSGINAILNLYFPDISDPNERGDLKNLLNLLAKDKGIGLSVLGTYLSSGKTGSKETLMTLSKMEGGANLPLFKEIILLESKLENKFKTLSGSLSKITTLTAALAGIAVAAIATGPIMPLLILPATILSLKSAPSIGEKIGEIFFETSEGIKNQRKFIKNLTQRFVTHETEKAEKQEIKIEKLKSNFPELSQLKSGLRSFKVSAEEEMNLTKKTDETFASKKKKEEQKQFVKSRGADF